MNRKSKATSKSEQNDRVHEGLEEKLLEMPRWKTELSEILHSMDPYVFEKLAMYVLRECGFIDVSVTNPSRDGGIDGTVRLKINGIFSMNVAFQRKRYKGSVGASIVNEFRGSLPRGIEKGVIITTGTFTRDAKAEATNVSKIPIDLIDGDEFMDML